MSLRTALVSLSLFALCAQAPAPPDPASRPKQVIGVRLSPAIPASVEKYIIDIGVPSVVQAAPGEQLSQLAIRKCGHRTPYFVTRAAWLNQVSSSQALPEKRNIRLPPCPFWQINVRQSVNALTTVGELLTSATGSARAPALAAFAKQNPQLGAVTADTVLPPATYVILPYRTEWRGVELKPELKMSANDALTALRLKIRSRIETGDASVKPSPNGTFMHAMNGKILSEGGTECRPPAERSRWPFDPTTLQSGLNRSIATAKTLNLYDEQPMVAVLDSNFPEMSGIGLLADRIVRIGPSVLATSGGVDGNDLTKGGVSYSNIADRDHGTMVFSLALGGPSFLDADAKTRWSRIRVRANTVQAIMATGTTPGGAPTTEVTEAAVAKAMAEATDAGATVVNMSFTFSSELSILERVIKDRPSVLVVAAAGNDSGNFDEYAVMPAALGGVGSDLASQIVTVGATEAEGNKADFSNYDEARVDLFAPGCEVSAYDFKGQPVKVTGTSMAAPLTTFTAGLLRELGMRHPAYIKQRLIASTDVHRGLLTWAWSGGTLNPVKAVSLFDDYLEIDGAPSPVQGKVAWPAVTTWHCNDNGPDVDPNKVLKAARIDPAGAKANWLVIWRQDESLRKCYASLNDELILIPGRPGYESMGAIKDFVAAQPIDRFRKVKL
jgi:hypothetical protein